MSKVLIDRYLKNLPEPQKSTLTKLRKTIKKTVGDGQTVAINTTYDLFDFDSF